VSLLCQVQRAKGDCLYLETWGVEWVERGLDALEENQLLYFFSLALMTFPEVKVLTAARERRLRRIVAVAARTEGGVSYEHALFWHWQSLPILFPNEREDLEKRLSVLLA
jgi:hypothetical protein